MSWHRSIEALKQALTLTGRRRAHAALSNLGDRQLRDVGFSSELVAQGVHAWPWRESEIARGNHRDSAADSSIAETDSNACGAVEQSKFGISTAAVPDGASSGRVGIHDMAA